jgi:hypothetical protein
VSFDELMSVAEALPYALREQVVGFATFVEDAADALLEPPLLISLSIQPGYGDFGSPSTVRHHYWTAL